MKILANDGLSDIAIQMLTEAGFSVETTKVAQNQLVNYINSNGIKVLLVRSATKVTKEVLESCPTLLLIGRAGIGLDNIDVAFAKEKNIPVINTPKASTQSVAELVIAHLFTCVRSLQESNRHMPLDGDIRFNELKNAYSKGIELKGKTLGIIGFGMIGQRVAELAIGLGMRVVASDITPKEVKLQLEFFNGKTIDFDIVTTTIQEVLEQSDFITLHTPSQKGYLLAEPEFAQMKKGVGIINTARGNLINEVDLTKAIDDEIVSFAGLDVFLNEPQPSVQVLMNPHISLTPHIGAGTTEAQDRVGIELAQQVIEILKN